MQQLIDRCLKVFENEYLADTTNLVYDYRNTLDHDHRWDALPTPEEIAKRLPNPCSWGSGMENGMINTPIALSISAIAFVLISSILRLSITITLPS